MNQILLIMNNINVLAYGLVVLMIVLIGILKWTWCGKSITEFIYGITRGRQGLTSL
jgi:hypothetical protein